MDMSDTIMASQSGLYGGMDDVEGNAFGGVSVKSFVKIDGTFIH